MKDAYSALARQVANRLLSDSTEVDCFANDRQDYESELRLKAWSVRQMYRKRHPEAPLTDEKKYVAKSLWSSYSGFLRRRQYRQSVQWMFLEGVSDESSLRDGWEGKSCVDGHLEARSFAKSLPQFLTETELELVYRMAETWKPGRRSGMCAELFNPKLDGSYDALKRRIQRLRQKVKSAFPEFAGN